MIDNNVLLFNLPVKLEYFLGTINQITLRKLIDCDIKIEEITFPFLMDRNIVEGISIFDIIIVNKIRSKPEMFDGLVRALSVLYDSSDIEFNENTNSIVIDNKYVVDRDNFIYLCDVVLDLFKIDFSHVQKEYDKKRKSDAKPKSDIELEFERRRKAYMEKQERLKKERNIKDKKSFNIFDKANYVIHKLGINYDEILNWSIYQVENSFELYRKFEQYEQDRNYFTSGNFNLEGKELTHWFFN